MTTIQVSRVRETTTGVADGVDADVVVDGLSGEVTLAPAQYDGALRPYGSDPSMWVSGKLLSQLSDEQLSDLHDEIGALVTAQVNRLKLATQEMSRLSHDHGIDIPSKQATLSVGGSHER